MLSTKTKYFIQVALMVIVFLAVLGGLLYKYAGEMAAESIRKQAEEIEKEKIAAEFIATIEDQYNEMEALYQAKEYDKVIEVIKVFKEHGQADYKDLPKIKKEIQLIKLKKTLELIPKIGSDSSSQPPEKPVNTDTEVFIRTPRYGQYFYAPSDFPISFEGIALSLTGDFSEDILWSSSLDGNLGKGKKISARLSVGEHRITATGTNGITTGTMETLVYIWPDSEK